LVRVLFRRYAVETVCKGLRELSMKRIIMLLALAPLVFPMAATAQDLLRMGDVGVVHQPEPASYQPEGSTLDLADQGKSFDIACVVGGDGRLGNCKALANDMIDQNFVKTALDNADDWVVQPRDSHGRSTAGRTFVITCQFKRKDETAGAPSLAAADSK